MGDRQVSIALIGIGGYGNRYVGALLDALAGERTDVKIAATADPNPSTCNRLAELQSRGVPLFASMDALYAEHRPDLVVISTPLHLHAIQTCFALSQGSHVLCEKPLCVTPEQGCDMLRARDKAQRHVAIGYQWSFSKAVTDLKADVRAGKLGRAKRLRTMVLWPRDEMYYSRNSWAGAKRDSRGNLVLDSPVNNACAHYLHNMLYVTGAAPDRSAHPQRLTAEVYRAHPIDNYDTAALRYVTTDGVEGLFLASHATAVRRGPILHYEFERATVEFVDRPDATVIARFVDGTVKDYGSPNDDRDRKLWTAVDVARSADVRIPCGIEAAAPHMQCTWATQQSMPLITPFPEPLIHVAGPNGSRRTSVQGLDEVLEQCYEQWRLPSELGAVAWAKSGREIGVPESLCP
jgi:predicted dehydrogenase